VFKNTIRRYGWAWMVYLVGHPAELVYCDSLSLQLRKTSLDLLGCRVVNVCVAWWDETLDRSWDWDISVSGPSQIMLLYTHTSHTRHSSQHWIIHTLPLTATISVCRGDHIQLISSFSSSLATLVWHALLVEAPCSWLHYLVTRTTHWGPVLMTTLSRPHTHDYTLSWHTLLIVALYSRLHSLNSKNFT